VIGDNAARGTKCSRRAEPMVVGEVELFKRYVLYAMKVYFTSVQISEQYVLRLDTAIVILS
jgi:hypothetical protein